MLFSKIIILTLVIKQTYHVYIVCVYSGIGNGGFNSLDNQSSPSNDDLLADRKNGRKQKGLLKTFGEVFK